MLGQFVFSVRKLNNCGNIRFRRPLKINVGCLSLASAMNGCNIRLRMTRVDPNLGCLSLSVGNWNGGNTRLRMTLKSFAMSSDCI